MAANYIDIAHDDEASDIAVVVGGTVTEDVRVTYNDDGDPIRIIEALDRAKNKLIRIFG